MNMIDVLIVEDSLVARDLLVYILKSDKQINVIGMAKNGKEAVDFINVHKPNVITMDINMPVMDGIEATKIIMATNPIPIIIVSSHWNSKDVGDSFKALQIGALALTEKPAGFDNPRFKDIAENLIQIVKLMAEMKVVKRLRTTKLIQDKVVTKEIANANYKPKVVCIGASTGGPVVIEKILSGLAIPFPFPIVIVQHIIAGFAEGFVEWLNHSSKVKVKLAEQGEILLNNTCYVAPDFYQLSISADKIIQLQNLPPVNGLKPAVSFLFESALASFGKECLPILLSGMGKDGSAELKKLKNAGTTTIVQDMESSVVYGMPGEAVRLNAATHVYAPGEIINFLNNLSKA